MIVRWLLAAIHLSAFGVAFAAIAARNRALRRLIASAQPADLPGVFKADAVWGLSALVLIATGLARAFGGFGATVEKTEDFSPAFEAAQKSGKPAILHVKIDSEAITPTTTLASIRQKALSDRG